MSDLKSCLTHGMKGMTVPTSFSSSLERPENLSSNSDQFSRMKRHIDSCCTTKIHVMRVCIDCGEPDIDSTFLQTCGNRYCKKCYIKRFAITHARIFDNYRKYYHKRCIHLIFTLPRGFYTKAKKKEFEYLIYRFFLKLRKMHYPIVGIKAMDLTLGSNGVNLHCHTALRITFQLSDINKHILHQTWVTVTHNKHAVIKLKYSSTTATLTYIAKRTAGMIGHKPEVKFLSDYMTMQQYFQLLYRSRYITPIGISCKIAPNFKTLVCQKCGGTYFAITEITYTELNVKDCQKTLGFP